MLRHFFCICLVLVTYTRVMAQHFDEKEFTRYTKLDGLSHNYVTGIVQDSTGYIWIATNKGLNRFDGKSFSSIFKRSPNSPLPQNLILSIGLQNGNEMIGTTVGGAFSYNTISQKHQSFIVPADSVIFFWTNQAWQALKEKTGNYVVSTKTGLYVFNPKGKIISRYDHYRPQDAGRKEIWFGSWLSLLGNGAVFQANNLSGSVYRPLSNQIDTFFAAKQKSLLPLFGSKLGDERVSFPGAANELFLPNIPAGTMDVYNLLTGDQYSCPVPPSVLSDLDWYSKLFYINDSLLAVTSKVGGFYLLQYAAREKKLACNGEKYFPSRYCTALFKDREGRLWIGTNDGLYKQNVRNSFFTVEDLSLQLPSVLNTGILSVSVVKEKILVGLRNEGGLLLLEKKTKKIERHISFERFGEGSNTINFIFSYHPDTVWLGTAKGILWLHIRNYSSGRLNLPGQPPWMNQTKTRNYLEDSKGNIWLSFGGLNSLLLFNRSEHRFHDLSKSPLLRITFCFSMIEDKNKNVWIAGDGLCRWNSKKMEIDTLIPYPAASQSLFNYIQLLDCDENNNLWFSSFDNEILQYDCTHNRMYLRLPENSMIDGYSVTNSPIINDCIWLGMGNGISAFNVKDYSIKQFNYADGLPSAVATSPRKGSFYHAPENCFYFGAGQYLISFIPDISRSNKPLPRFSIELAGTNMLRPGRINLPYSQNDIELRFNAINFTDPEENRFAYRLLNEKDSSWRELNTRNIVVLSKLSPGNHTIHVRLFSVNNRWPAQTRTITIYVYPPFWRTAWFSISAALLIMVLLYAFYRSRIKRIRQRANLDKQLAEFEIKALHAQMNPHFVFNCLNSIREMILNKENQQASHYLSKFAHLMRMTLHQSSTPFISLKETMDYLHRYLEMEQIRSTHFVYTLEAEEDIETRDIFLPPMLIQPFIENAIWHGVPASAAKPLEISVRFFREKEQLFCVIEDNGIGIDASIRQKEHSVTDHHSVGIANVRQRIQVLNEKYNLQSSLSIEDKSRLSSGSETGTLVTIKLLIKNSA